MKKTTREWKARDLGVPTRVQHSFIDKPAHHTSVKFSFPQLRTLRNQAQQLSVTATTLPTCGPQQQSLAVVARVSKSPNTARSLAQPVTQADAQPKVRQRAVRITTPKPPSPKAQERPPALLPPLPGRMFVNDSTSSDDDEDDTSSDGSSTFDTDDEEIYEEETSVSVSNVEMQTTNFPSALIKFPQQCCLTELFPATLTQVHHLFDLEQLQGSESSNKIDNIVRGMKIHGPLNINLLSKALEQVVKLHHILSLRALHTRTNDNYMLQASSDKAQINLSVIPGNSSELPTSIIAQERRRLFHINIKNDSPDDKDTSPGGDLHVTSVTDNDVVNSNDKMWTYETMARAKLLQYSMQDYLLVLTFSQLVCDYWSSCLILQQLSQAYSLLEAAGTASRALTKSLRDDSRSLFSRSMDSDGSQQRFNRSFPGTRTAFVRTASKLQPITIRQHSHTTPLPTKTKHNSLLQPTQLHFQQVAVSEQKLLSLMSKEKLWSFWQSTVTAIIKRALGPNRLKVVPPARLPSRLGEGKLRPKTSKTRPLTARRIKILGSDKNYTQSGPVKSFHFIKIEEAICSNFKGLFLRQGARDMKQEDVLHCMCLAGFVLLLGRCCRGWAPKQSSYKTRPQTASLFDVGSFLVGMELSLRQRVPEQTRGLVGPLTNNAAIRVNLSASETFTDLVINLWKSVYSARNHSHYPFSTVAHDLGMPDALPIKFSYLSQHDVMQLTNPQNFYFVETAIGVEGHGLARLGSSCYLTPINSKLDDNCYLELMMWESIESRVVGGGFLYHNHVIAPDIVAKLGRELCHLLALAAEDPNQTLANLIGNITPPFTHNRPAYGMK